MLQMDHIHIEMECDSNDNPDEPGDQLTSVFNCYHSEIHISSSQFHSHSPLSLIRCHNSNIMYSSHFVYNSIEEQPYKSLCRGPSS